VRVIESAGVIEVRNGKMGAGGSTGVRKESQQLIQKQPFETTMSYRIRVKFQLDESGAAEEFSRLMKELESVFGSAAGSSAVARFKIEDMLERLHASMNIAVTKKKMQKYYGFYAEDLSIREIGRLFNDISYNPTIGAIYAALLRERDQLSDQVWQEFQMHYQGLSQQSISDVTSIIEQYCQGKGPPKSAIGFERFLLSKANSAFHPRLQELRRFNRPISEYFIQVARIPDVKHFSSEPERVVQAYAQCISRGARVVEFLCSGGASDGKPRVFSDSFPENTPADVLPRLQDVLEACEKELSRVQNTSAGRGNLSRKQHSTCKRLPLIVCISVDGTCSESYQLEIVKSLKDVFGSKLGCPPLNDDGTIWSISQLEGKILVVSPSFMMGGVDEEGNVVLGEPVSNELQQTCHLRMVTVNELRPILDQASSRRDLRKLLQGVVLTVGNAELCAHIMELSSITDMLLVHVQTSKRSVAAGKKGNLIQRDETDPAHQDTRHVVQYSELRDERAPEIICKQESIVEEKMEELEPLRGWRYGAQMVPVEMHSFEEASLQAAALFKQHGANGFVPKVPRDMFFDQTGFIDLYGDFGHDYARSLFITVLSATRIPRDQVVEEPFLKVFCNNGTGLKQVAITSTVEDNGFNLVWEEDFEFKFHINDINAAACLIFTIHDRIDLQNKALTWASVPLWGLQTGYRSLQLFNTNGNEVDNAVLFLHFDWEPED